MQCPLCSTLGFVGGTGASGKSLRYKKTLQNDGMKDAPMRRQGQNNEPPPPSTSGAVPPLHAVSLFRPAVDHAIPSQYISSAVGATVVKKLPHICLEDTLDRLCQLCVRL
jgi:hypothetical protein